MEQYWLVEGTGGVDGVDEGRVMAHNVSSVAGGGPAMMWHCSDPPHVFFGPLRLLLHPSHEALWCDGPSPSPHPPPRSTPQALPKPCPPGLNRPLLCSKPDRAISHIKVRFNGPLGNVWPSLSPTACRESLVAHSKKRVLWRRLDTWCYTLVSQCRSQVGSLLSVCTRPTEVQKWLFGHSATQRRADLLFYRRLQSEQQQPHALSCKYVCVP